jgi:MarR family transcriptional regulator, transcriptional regulator for hemolysin
MEKIDEILFYTLEKSIKVYRKFALSQITNKGFNITIDQWLILKTLQENKQLSQNQIAELVYKDVASLTRILELLVKKNFVKRKISVTDRRKFDLVITETGNLMIKNIYPIIIENRKQALKGLNKENITKLKSLLEKMISNCK